jgi:hypothetical protein
MIGLSNARPKSAAVGWIGWCREKPIPNDFNHLHFGAGQTKRRLHTLQLLFGDKDHDPHSPPVMSHRIRVVMAQP